MLSRSTVAETLSEDYVLAARGSGLAPRTIMGHFALRNAAPPLATATALQLGFVVGGATLVETVFAWPGIGRAVYEAVQFRDYPMFQGAFLVLTISVVLSSLIADLLYVWLDPRTRR